MNSIAYNKIKSLPPEKQREVEDFVDFLFDKYHQSINDGNGDIKSRRQQALGRLSGRYGWLMILITHLMILKNTSDGSYFRYTNFDMA